MWFDRLSQKNLKELPASIDAGRYLWRLDSGNAASEKIELFNQHSDITDGKLLVSDGGEHWQLNRISGHFHKPAVDKLERITVFKKAILTLGETLSQSANSVHHNTESQQLLSPLLPGAVIDAELNLLPLESTLQTVLEAGHLHEIAHHPRLDIRYVEETTDVARAKRLAKGALVHLASHSECWQRQTLSGVVPKKVKARFSEDDYQIYENRVFARLIDNIYRHLSSRIRTLDQLHQSLDDALGFEDKSDAIDYRVRQKICALWGQTFDAEATLHALDLLDNTRSSLKAMLKSITSLRQSGLYLMIPRYAQVGTALHRTNILNHDVHYRHLAILWDELNRLQQSSQLTPAQRFSEEQLLASHYSHYAGLVLQHALAGNTQIQLKSTETSTKPLNLSEPVIDYTWANQTLRLQQKGYDWTLSLIQQEYHHRTPANDEQILLEFIPWLGFTPIPDLMPSQPDNRVFLWPSIDQISNSCAEAEQPGWYALSPLDLYCVERLGWLLDRTLNEHLTLRYAQPIEKIPTKAAEAIQGIQQRSPSAVELSGTPPQARLLEGLDQQDAINLNKALNYDNAMSQANQFRHQLSAITTLALCPVCGAHTPLKHQQPTGFRIECQSCNTGRYLTNAGEKLEIRFRENSMISTGFAARGRWAFLGI